MSQSNCTDSTIRLLADQYKATAAVHDGTWVPTLWRPADSEGWERCRLLGLVHSDRRVEVQRLLTVTA